LSLVGYKHPILHNIYKIQIKLICFCHRNTKYGEKRLL